MTQDVRRVEMGGNLLQPVTRKGRWRVPARLLLRRRMGWTRLDFTQAEFEAPVIDIELDIFGGSVELRVPEGASVSIDRVETGLGSAEDHRRGKPVRGRPHFAISGLVRMGSFEVRGPARRFLGGARG